MRPTLTRMALLLLSASTLTACAAGERLSYVGQAPPMSPMENIGSMNMGAPNPAIYGSQDPQTRHIAQLRSIAATRGLDANPGSLWRGNARSFFGDPRAANVGDILTVNIDISDRAQVSNQTNQSRTNDTDSNLTSFFGGEAALGQFFNDAVDPASLASFGSSTATQGSGSVNRSESISLTAAAIVVEVLWNGNMIVQGRQEVRINNEVRELLISGIVRPQDIEPDNTIDHTKIAEARVSYGGRGHISDMQRPPIGQELYNLLWPF